MSSRVTSSIEHIDGQPVSIVAMWDGEPVPGVGIAHPFDPTSNRFVIYRDGRTMVGPEQRGYTAQQVVEILTRPNFLALRSER